MGNPQLQVEIFGYEPQKLTVSSVVRRLMGKLARTRFGRFSEDFWAVGQGRWLDSSLPHNVSHAERTIVLTVAHGDVCMAALRFAQKYNLPLVTFFHDWWPDIPLTHARFRRRLENNFQRLYQGSAAALCVSEGMKAALGNHANAPVIYPIPQVSKTDSSNSNPPVKDKAPFQVFYSGNVCEYGPMLGGALEVLEKHEKIRLEVRGANPNWSPEFREAMRVRGLWKDFAPRDQLNDWLSEADAFLIAMVFDEKLQRRMATSFPSKLTEFAQFGKPLVIWGPEGCSAVQWAQQGNRALCVTDPNPAALRKALEALVNSPAEQQRLADAAFQAAKTDFNPHSLQARFMEILHQVAMEGKNYAL